jgi:hypothetical protein
MRRPYGSGQLYEKSGAYYGRWRTADGRRLNRRLGPKRTPGEAGGLTPLQAERALRRFQAAEAAARPREHKAVPEIMTVDQVAALLRDRFGDPGALSTTGELVVGVGQEPASPA